MVHCEGFPQYSTGKESRAMGSLNMRGEENSALCGCYGKINSESLFGV